MNPPTHLRSGQSVPLQHSFSIRLLFARILKTILPRSWFCWLSRGTIQLQAFLRPHRWSYWTKISDQIYLGAMPLKNKDHLNKIANLGVKAVLSINEDYELEDQWFAKPVKPLDWQKKNIKILRISSPDMEPIEVSKLAEAIDYVVQQVQAGNSIYVHCTAGRSRSASAVAGAVVRLKNCSLEKAIKHVQTCRPQVILSQQQKNAVHTYCRLNASCLQ